MGKRDKKKKHIIRRIFFMTFFLPASIVFFTNMNGLNIREAFHKSFTLIIKPPTGPFIWIFILVLNVCIYIYLKPVISFYTTCSKKFDPEISLQKLAAKKFNSLPSFVLAISVIGFLIGFILEIILSDQFNKGRIPLLYGFFEAISTGLFTGTLLALNIENLLFTVKRRVFRDNDIQKQKYSSFYRKLFFTMCAIVFFLIFQIFDSFSNFYLIEIDREMKSGIPGSGNLLSLSREHEGLKKIMNVFFLRVFIYFFYIAHLLRQLKWMIKNPLQIVNRKLKSLNSNKQEVFQQIDIVNNDEFTQIYREINTLIDKQNLELQRSEEQLEKIVENAADPIISFHENGNIHLFNPAAELFFGYKREDILERQITTLYKFPENIKKKALGNKHFFIDYLTKFDTRLKRFSGIKKNGEIINFESNVSRSETEHGVLYTSILRDITGQIEFEENLKKAKVSAENANKMKSEFLANMSHELRTPLNAVLGFTQLLSNDKNLTQGQLDKISTISRSGEHLLALINDILDISKIESGKTEMHSTVFDLNQFVMDLKEMFILRCRTKDLSLYVEFAGEIPKYVEGDLGKLRQIMINLIGNSVKFTQEGGISLLVGRKDGKIRFSIKDTGKGIPEKDVEKILEPFMQSSNVDHEGGTGLGLAISNRFIEMMGGKLEIESSVVTGSTFSFEIPLKISETAPLEDKNQGVVVSIKGRMGVKALIVDDKLNNRLILKAMLENVGFITMEAVDGEQAIERTKEFDPGIIFMDIKMPVMDGYESVALLKATEQGKSIKIFALTASAFKHDEKRIYESGFDGFLPKPFKQNSLFSLITRNSDIEFNYATETKNGPEEIHDISDLDYNIIAEGISIGELDQLAENILINDFTAIRNFSNKLIDREGMANLVSLICYFADNFNEERLEEIVDRIKEIKQI